MALAIRLTLLTAILTLLSGCGFQLRGSDLLLDHFSQLHLASDNPHAPLARTMKDRLDRYEVQVLANPAEGAPNLYLYPEQLDRTLLSLFATGQVAEYELIYHVRYEIQMPGEEARLVQFNLSREYQDDPDAVLAKSRELNLILDELRARAADRIIRQLSRIRPSNQPQTPDNG
ncbi:LPS assembly lipoprotein LptE [Aliiglaciecola sp. CAU 1673]|uniref:LPS-assembly lipoprotein LptE n=1 Tax=Aliiglaciecola sp. CAU 1673 TaxID=3032595 RepID=UPI0023DB9F56|nr:LPS assembly lipoprotein LptE [Aliiglaciecola sp. CAU 1673]MDF2179340.1 LPS assembly lipoprotein LptE [Aliiglaciecola sp. CAU 1673]